MENKNNSTYTASINGKKSLPFSMTESGLTLGGENIDIDLIHISGQSYHLLVNNVSFEVDVLEVNPNEKSFLFSFQGEEVEVKLEDSFDAMVKKMGLSAQAGQKLNEIKAPMPGLVLDIHVEVGDAIGESDDLLTIEAMKMENKLTATAEAVVKEVHVSKGDKVDKNQVLISFE